MADFFGRRTTIIVGCLVYIIGVILQTAMSSIPLLVVGRLIAGFGVGFVSASAFPFLSSLGACLCIRAVIILYMSEISPKRVRGAIVSGYQFCITIGLLLASVVAYSTKDRTDSGSYRIPIAIQFLWAIILAVGLFLLPESPRYFIKKGNVPAAIGVLARLRGQPADSEYIQAEIAEIIACVSSASFAATYSHRSQQPRVRA